MSEHSFEVAPSGRSKCRGCGDAIARGEVRFGERLPNPFGEGDMVLCKVKGHCTVHGTAIYILKAQLSGHSTGSGTFTTSTVAVYCNNNLLHTGALAILYRTGNGLTRFKTLMTLVCLAALAGIEAAQQDEQAKSK